MFSKKLILLIIFTTIANAENNMTHKIETKNAPLPIGPYSQAISTQKNNFLFISGQLPLDANGQIITDITQATNQIMIYLQAILNEAEMDFSNVAKTTIYLTNLGDFANVNAAYGLYFKNITNLPARETVQVAALPKGATVEISMIAVK
ncbi:MAG: Rid family detoxifying hydrolase [Candidatus Babeliales bacterium]|nr:Rid family detoxifying hydrolase [Candidatus Babeliales bacterium]